MRVVLVAGAACLLSAGVASGADSLSGQTVFDVSMLESPGADTELTSLRGLSAPRTIADGDPFAAAAVFFLDAGGFNFLDALPDEFLFGEIGMFAGNNVLSGVPVVITTESAEIRAGEKVLQVSFLSEDGSDLMPIPFARSDFPNGSAQYDIGQEFALQRTNLNGEAGIQFTGPVTRRLVEVEVVLFRDGVPFLESTTPVDEIVGPEGLRWSVLLGQGETQPRGGPKQLGFFGLGIDEVSIAFLVQDVETPVEPAAVPLLSHPGLAGFAGVLGVCGAAALRRRQR